MLVQCLHRWPIIYTTLCERHFYYMERGIQPNHNSFLKFVALCSSLGGTYYRYIILLPIRINSVMICCSKSSEISKDMVAGSPCATSN